MDDILKRLGNVEGVVSELRSQVAGILALIPQLATKADVADLKAAVAIIPHLATKADVADLKAATKADVADLKAAAKADVADLKEAVMQVKVDVASLETKMIKWIISTVLTSTTLAFTIAKFVH